MSNKSNTAPLSFLEKVGYDLRKTNFKEVKKLIENLNVNETEDDNSTKIEIPVVQLHRRDDKTQNQKTMETL